LFGRAAGGEGSAARLAGIAQHAAVVRTTVVLDLLQCFSAPVLAVTLYAITRDEDRDLAMLGLTCRVGEGLIGAVGIRARSDCFGLRRPPERARRIPRRRMRSARSCSGGTWP
jgi:Domain of unknown function (DUF4386)